MGWLYDKQYATHRYNPSMSFAPRLRGQTCRSIHDGFVRWIISHKSEGAVGATGVFWADCFPVNARQNFNNIAAHRNVGGMLNGFPWRASVASSGVRASSPVLSST